MQTKNIINELLEKFPKFIENKQLGNQDSILEKECDSLIEKLISNLVNNPGELIYYPDKSNLKVAQKLTTLIWDTTNSDEIFQNVSLGDDSIFMVNLLGDYSDRIKKLRPSFVTTEPNNTEFEIIYKECMNAWLFGLNNAAIILCCSLIENLLKEKLKEVPKWEIYHTSNGLGSQNRKLKSLDSLIKDAKKHNILEACAAEGHRREPRTQQNQAHKTALSV